MSETRIARSALVPHSAEEMFDLVADVMSYPAYMDGCVGAEILNSESSEMLARLDLKKAGIRQSFVTRNQLYYPRRIELVLEEGPFLSFHGGWDFMPLGELGCKVSLELVFVLNNRLVSRAAGRVFKSVADNQVASLTRRAAVVYAASE